MIEFLWPWAITILPLPLLLYFLVPAAKRSDAALHVPFYTVAVGYASDSNTSQRRKWFGRLMLLLIWLCLVVAATRPQFIGEPIELPTSGRDLLLAVDISGSMGQDDMKKGHRVVMRLDVVKDVVGDFVERRQGDRMGLILFGTQAYLQTPLTFDRNTVRTLLQETPLGIAGERTAIGDAIGLAVKRLQDRPEENRVLILLSDGYNNAGEVDPLLAAGLAAKEGIRIYTIGFGAEEMVTRGLLFNRRVNPSADLDTETLTEIARLTGGIYRRAKSADELAEIYAEMDRLEPIEQNPEIYRPVRTLFHWPLMLAIVLSLLYASVFAMHTIRLITFRLAGNTRAQDSGPP